MKNIEITKEELKKQMEDDIQLEKELANSFYSIRVNQLKEILKNGEGIFSIFKNENVYITVK